jgi:hypothetical protein
MKQSVTPRLELPEAGPTVPITSVSSKFSVMRLLITMRSRSGSRAFVRAKDGRGAWNAFKIHYLGTSQLDSIAERADLIETRVYTGAKTRSSFESHVSTFKKAHLDLKKAGNEPDDRTKVRKILQSVKAPDSSRCGTKPRQVSYRLRRNY